MNQLEGRVAIVTGAASGIGRTCALRFAREGARVALADRDAEGLAETMKLLDEAGHGESAYSMVVDLRSLSEVEGLVDATADHFGGIDIIYNNAGISISGTVEDHTEELWDLLFDVNVKSQFFLIRRALPWLRKSPAPSVINVGSMAAQFGHNRLSAYCASKGAVLMMTRALAVELAPDEIRVNCLCPGLTRTPLVDVSLGGLEPSAREAQFDSWIGRHLFKRMGEPDEVIDAAIFLASSQSSFITGEVLSVSGGWQAW